MPGRGSLAAGGSEPELGARAPRSLGWAEAGVTAGAWPPSAQALPGVPLACCVLGARQGRLLGWRLRASLPEGQMHRGSQAQRGQEIGQRSHSVSGQSRPHRGSRVGRRRAGPGGFLGGLRGPLNPTPRPRPPALGPSDHPHAARNPPSLATPGSRVATSRARPLLPRRGLPDLPASRLA